MSAKSEPQALVQPIPPLFDAQSRVLILGSFPSVKSREAKFFYGHPQNRFWRVLAALTGSPLPATIEEKTRLILENHFALWDSIASCTITGSSARSMRDVVAKELAGFLAVAHNEKIFCNGAASLACYRRYIEPVTHRAASALPSTSPANAAWTLERLIEAWRVIL